MPQNDVAMTKDAPDVIAFLDVCGKANLHPKRLPGWLVAHDRRIIIAQRCSSPPMRLDEESRATTRWLEEALGAPGRVVIDLPDEESCWVDCDTDGKCRDDDECRRTGVQVSGDICLSYHYMRVLARMGVTKVSPAQRKPTRVGFSVESDHGTIRGIVMGLRMPEPINGEGER